MQEETCCGIVLCLENSALSSIVKLTVCQVKHPESSSEASNTVLKNKRQNYNNLKEYLGFFLHSRFLADLKLG